MCMCMCVCACVHVHVYVFVAAACGAPRPAMSICGVQPRPSEDRVRHQALRPHIPHPTAPSRWQEPYGVFIPLETGLTPAAEMMNGRMAMFGLVFLITSSMVTGMDILDIVNAGIGGLYGKIN